MLEAANPLLSGLIVLSNDTCLAMTVWIPEKYQINKDVKGHRYSIYRQRNKGCAPVLWMDGSHTWTVYFHSWQVRHQDHGRSWKNSYTGWHKNSRLDLWEQPVEIILLFFPHPPAPLQIPELLTSLHQLPGCCWLAIHHCLAAQRLVPLRATVTTSISYINQIN